MDHSIGIFQIPDYSEGLQFAVAQDFISPEPIPSKACHLGESYHPEHRTHHELQLTLPGVSIRIAILHPANWNASGEAL
jgi:hypothetical protein